MTQEPEKYQRESLSSPAPEDPSLEITCRFCLLIIIYFSDYTQHIRHFYFWGFFFYIGPVDGLLWYFSGNIHRRSPACSHIITLMTRWIRCSVYILIAAPWARLAAGAGCGFMLYPCLPLGSALYSYDDYEESAALTVCTRRSVLFLFNIMCRVLVCGVFCFLEIW